MLTFISKIKKYISCDLAIDLGTSRTLIIDTDRGLLVDEATAVAINEVRGQIIAVAFGNEALEMKGKEARNHRVVFPLKNGVISDPDIAECMLTYFVEKSLESHPNKLFKPNPRIVITVPSYATEIEKRSIKELALKSGASEVHIVEQSLAAAIGANLDISDNNGHVVIHIGAGVTEISVISMNDIVITHTVEYGGTHFTQEIKKYFRSNHQLNISTETAERLKIELGTAIMPAVNDPDADFLTISALDIGTNLPKEIVVKEIEIYKALRIMLAELVNGLMEALADITPELSGDLLKNGIYLTGGGSKLSNLDKMFNRITQLDIKLIKSPEKAAVKGCSYCFKDLE
jgi:rod shape-determining protein MreB